MQTPEQLMRRAIALSAEKMRAGLGGPFGALIVRDGKIIAEGHNQVTSSNDPTAHAEVVAIRAACRQLGSFNLQGSEMYTSCEPCPMCLGAIYWARLDRVYYANTRIDAAAIGFDDDHRAKDEGDTLGGAVTVIAHHVPVGLGSHVQWDEKLDGRLAQALLSVPAVKAMEIGSGLAAARGFGSAAHDAIERTADGRWVRPTNRAGGLEGGITNGEDLVLTAYKKPISTLRKGLPSVDLDTLEPHASQYERSDVTALPAAGVIAEAMVALVLADALLDKLGGDSMSEVRAHWEATRSQQQAWLR